MFEQEVPDEGKPEFIFFISSSTIKSFIFQTDDVIWLCYLLPLCSPSLSLSLPPGTTCLVALLSDKELTVANVGDSRGVLCDKDGNAVPLSHDHKPYQLKERKRIKKAGEAKTRQSGRLYCVVSVDCLSKLQGTSDYAQIVVRKTSNESSHDQSSTLLSFIPTSVCL